MFLAGVIPKYERGAGFFVLTIKRTIEIGLGLQKNAQIVF